MAGGIPQPPPMAYHPGTDRLNPILTSAIIGSKLPISQGQSPFSPASSPHHHSNSTSPNPGSRSPASDGALGNTMSAKSSFSSTTSKPASPASMSYSPAVQSALRDSARSSRSSTLSTMVPPRAHSSKSQKDLEKQEHIPARSSRTAPSNCPTSTHYHESSYGHPDDEEEDAELKAEEKAVRILLYLSGPNCLISLGIALYTIVALLATMILQPVRLCTSGLPFRQSLLNFLGPTLRLQLNFICSVYDSETYSIPVLVAVNLLSPILALGVMGSAWIAAAFWFFNAILGDPDGSDKPKGYNDGRASVMAVRRWWETWLRRPLR